MNRMTTTRSSKQAPLNSGTLSPNPWDLSLSGQNADAKLGGTRTEGRAPQGCDLSAVPSAEMATGGLDAEATQTPKQRPVQTLAYCGQKMVLTMGSTLLGVWEWVTRSARKVGEMVAKIAIQCGEARLTDLF